MKNESTASVKLKENRAHNVAPGRVVRLRDRLAGLFILVAVGMSQPVFAGTIITANLPVNNVIININAKQDGAGNYSGTGQAFWYEPFSTLGSASLLEYTMQPGTYTFRVIDPTDASQMFPGLTSTQLAQIYTAWTFNSPWVTDYLVFDSSAANNSTVYQLFDGAFSDTNGVNWLTYGDAASAYDGAITNGFYNLIRPGPDGRSGTTYTTSYIFETAETLIFVIPDYDLGDNNGGVSVLIAPASASPIIPPWLALSASDGEATLSWPTNATGFSLQANTNLLTGNWSTVTNIPIRLGTNFTVSVQANLKERFFRLSQ